MNHSNPPRKRDGFHDHVFADGRGNYPAEAGRYHLYISHACPFSARAVLARRLKGLEHLVSMSAVDPVRGPDGWAFTGGEYADPLNGFRLLREAYEATDADYAGRCSVPVLWDRKRRRIVSTESGDIMLFPTLVRFDAVYLPLFKCSRNSLVEMSNLWNYTRDLYQLPGVAATVRHGETMRHYYRSFPALNPHGIVPLRPQPGFSSAHDRNPRCA